MQFGCGVYSDVALHLQVLVSTRLHHMRNLKPVHLLKLDDEEALELLRGETQGLPSEDLLALADGLGYLTLALAVSSSILAQGMLPKELLDELETKEAHVFDEEDDDPVFKVCPRLVPLFDISLDLVRGKGNDRSRVAELMLQVGGWFARAPIPMDLLNSAAASLGGRSEGGGPRAFSLLVQYSLGARNPQDGSVSFHELVRAYGRHLWGQAAGKAMLEALKEMGDPLQHTAHFQNACKQALPHLKPKLVLDQIELEQFLRDLTLPLVRHYEQVGLYHEAGGLLFDLDVDHLSDLVKADCLDWKADLYERCGEFERALELYTRGLQIKELILARDHPDLIPDMDAALGAGAADTLSNIAGVLCKQGKYAQAEPLLKRVLRTWEVIHGESHPLVAAALNNLATTFKVQGKYGQALQLYQRALEIEETCSGKDSLEVTGTLNNMGNVLETLGEYEQALPLHERALRIQEAALGMDHPKVAKNVNNMAVVLHALGRYEEALLLHERALGIKERTLGKDHPLVASTLHNMGRTLKAQGKSAEAFSNLQRALCIKETKLGMDHPAVASTLCNMAGILGGEGQFDEALRLFERASHIEKAAVGEAHPSFATTLAGIADIYSKQGRYREALSQHSLAKQIYEGALGPRHPSTEQKLRMGSAMLSMMRSEHPELLSALLSSNS
jgi:tetratricopeptide (TPR) repeat protein